MTIRRIERTIEIVKDLVHLGIIERNTAQKILRPIVIKLGGKVHA
jgi:hypothetical protein